ncbi:1-acyl-sn-glycerol-3-phosphate acyltransferase [Methylopila jiangsuensis]|uniref:1-acyl-sn-glycerol-3-phosphate acyltransferase n=1 Tax=Methylopila jiangsuensis TaxID=586230 RepID=A0A9W6N4W8_9HYPH|nr:1-acyl-sn-glycerol-3-phosphate acyltransferase [Methylopila jiangsuensis]MDR6284854.1 1-acyl-sn-glycerol-3-phosphate acyltransferase [Methylopila jiangsuensis]GLK77755.1 1-acyl-sn-glycerol-3-phosphate acyltransferase [Methylopila jiangsuensis]
MSHTAPRAGGVVFWRSVVYNALFSLQLVILALASLPIVLFFPRRHVLGVAKFWCRCNLALLKRVVGIGVEIRGREHIPQDGALIAAKHQSALETFAIVPFVPDPLFVLKRELTWVPFFGWFLMRLKMIAIDRSAGGDALAQMLRQARVAAGDGRQIIIFPEGTRRPVGVEPAYKHGVTHLYVKLGLPVTPVAIDTGVFWPRGGLRRRQGVSVIEFLEPIPPGLPRAEFERLLQERIEGRSNALAAEAIGAGPATRTLSGE